MGKKHTISIHLAYPLNKRLKLFISGEGQDGAADWSNRGGQGQPRTVLVTTTNPERVLQDGVHDSPDTKGQLDDGRYNIDN